MKREDPGNSGGITTWSINFTAGSVLVGDAGAVGTVLVGLAAWRLFKLIFRRSRTWVDGLRENETPSTLKADFQSLDVFDRIIIFLSLRMVTSVILPCGGSISNDSNEREEISGNFLHVRCSLVRFIAIEVR